MVTYVSKSHLERLLCPSARSRNGYPNTGSDSTFFFLFSCAHVPCVPGSLRPASLLSSALSTFFDPGSLLASWPPEIHLLNTGTPRRQLARHSGALTQVLALRPLLTELSSALRLKVFLVVWEAPMGRWWAVLAGFLASSPFSLLETLCQGAIRPKHDLGWPHCSPGYPGTQERLASTHSSLPAPSS